MGILLIKKTIPFIAKFIFFYLLVKIVGIYVSLIGS